MANNTEMNQVPVVIPFSASRVCGTMESYLDAFKELISDIDTEKIKLSEISVLDMYLDFFAPPMWRVPMVNPKPITLPKDYLRTCYFSNFEPRSVIL